MDRFIDIHSHILFGVDDGAKDFSESSYLLKQASKLGVEQIVCTPHESLCGSKLNWLRAIKTKLTLDTIANNQGVNLVMGTENILSPDLFEKIKHGDTHIITDTEYILFELQRGRNYSRYEIKGLFEQLISKKYKPILAHPEIYPNDIRDIEFLRELRDIGVFLQVDAENLIFRGNPSQTYITAMNLVELEIATIIASDAHGHYRSYDNLARSRDELSKIYTKERLSKLYYDNPKKVVENKTI